MNGSIGFPAADAGNTSLGTGSGTCSATCSGTDMIASTDTSGYGGGQMVIHITAFSGSATLTPATSNDNSTFTGVPDCWREDTGDLITTTITTAAAGVYICNIDARYFRLRWTTYGSGTQTGFWAMRPQPYQPSPSMTGAVGAGLVAALAAKASAGNLIGFNCTSITGGAAGFCFGYNATSCPTNGSAVTQASVLDACAFDTSNKGCSLSRNGTPSKRYGTGISICMTTAASPYATMASATDTGFISADFR